MSALFPRWWEAFRLFVLVLLYSLYGLPARMSARM
jgi:hypothetical protein